MKGKFWPQRKVLRVKFLGGSYNLRHKVLDYAKMWSKYANIYFEKVDTGDSDIRVSFAQKGHYSEIGTDNETVSQNKETMNLQINDFSSEEKIRRHTLHEFGHALGLHHEHLNPFVNIQWNIPKVYAFYAATQGWSHATVDQNVLNNLGWGPAQHTGFDPQSIMAYPIPDSLTTNGFSIPWNTELSALDKEFIGQMYDPKRIHVHHCADIPGTITFLLNGVFTTLKKDESIFVPIGAFENKLQIWECPNQCMWSSFEVTLNMWYKIVSDPDNPNDLSLEADYFDSCKK